MQVVENTLETTLNDVLGRPLFAFLAQSTPEGAPRCSPLWFHWDADAERVWHIAQLDGRSYPERVRADPRVALAVVDFDPAGGRVEHVGLRGRASLEPYDPERAATLLRNYLGPRPEWPERFRGLDAEGYRLLAVDPETVVARDGSYPA